MNKLAWLLIASMILITSACHRRDESGSQKSREAPGTARQDATVSVTNYTANTELYVEFPVLVKNEEALFAAHLTRLADFKAVADGKLTVILSGNGQPEERSETERRGYTNTGADLTP